IYVYKVNVDEESAVAQAFGIRSLPTILFVPTDEQPQAIMGAAPKAKLKEAVETILLKKEEKE
ncbi:MAG: thiol reductase thioredoxin, partial [Proteiniphilum sp.]|nr:thiol reductase thioredoxin [Proteiniphilum sp.]